MEVNAAFVFFKSFSAKHGKKGKEKRNDYSVIEQNALKRQLYGKYFKGSHPKMTGQNEQQDESLTGQVHDQAGPDIVRWPAVILTPVLWTRSFPIRAAMPN